MGILVTPTPSSLPLERVLSALQFPDPVAGDQIRVNHSGFILESDQGHVKHPLVRRSSVPVEVWPARSGDRESLARMRMSPCSDLVMLQALPQHRSVRGCGGECSKGIWSSAHVLVFEEKGGREGRVAGQVDAVT